MQLVSIVGPESTGKTTLAIELARLHHGVWLPEYAREYLSDTRYSEEEVHIVAREQLCRELDFVCAAPRFGVLDTDAVVLRIWFAEKFGHVPIYIQSHLERQADRCYLLTYPDLTWKFDPQRESKSDLFRLFEAYEQVLTELGVLYAVVKGQRNERTKCALENLESLWDVALNT